MGVGKLGRGGGLTIGADGSLAFPSRGYSIDHAARLSSRGHILPITGTVPADRPFPDLYFNALWC